MNKKKNLTTEETFALAIENHKKNNLQIAENFYKEALKINPNHFESIYYLGALLAQTKRFDLAKPLLHQASQIQPDYVDAHFNLGVALQELGEHQKAMGCYKKVIQIEPNNLTSHWLSMNTFPIIYKNLNEIDMYRKKFEDDTKKINHLLDTEYQYTKKQIVDSMKSSTNFYLSYQGRNDISLQKKYASLVERLTEKIYPQFHQERRINKSILLIWSLYYHFFVFLYYVCLFMDT